VLRILQKLEYVPYATYPRALRTRRNSRDDLSVPAVSGVTPIGQGWTNARGLRGLGGPRPDP